MSMTDTITAASDTQADPTQHIAPRLLINTDLAREVLVRFIRDSVSKLGFERVVLGISGGIDSAIVAWLSVDALGANNVLGVRMPYKTSSPDSLSDAQKVIDALGIEALTIPITAIADGLIAQFPDMSQMRKANIMSRSRMITLYDQSMATRSLVIGTSNKTEALLGYTTLYGDSASALQPITDLYKTQIRQLARALGLPQSILDKPPSADLWIGQTDEDELGYTYEFVDKVLYLLVDERLSIDEVAAEGFARDLVASVWKRVRQNQYKRTMPYIAKLGRRSIGHDFLYLRDWGSMQE
jgi:NAD+ synthase